MKTVPKKSGVPLEEALILAGGGLYTYYVVLTSGLINFSSLLVLHSMAAVMPVAGCELQLSDATRGIISSMTFTGMLFSAQIFGFLADTFGRKRVMMYSQLATLVVLLLWSLAPDTNTLKVILFINGFVLTGTLTPVYVFLSEFCSSHFRAKALLGMSAIGGLASVYLPGLAWVILPLDVYIPIFGKLVFTSWRLYILLVSIPVLLCLLLLSKLPETPKFLLSQGKEYETLEVLKAMYAVNQKTSKEEFPVSSISLDYGDEVKSNDRGSGNQFFSYFKMMIQQTFLLFSKDYILVTMISCILLLGITGTCNSWILWFPEQTSRIRHYSLSHEEFNVTLCNLMGGANSQHTNNCKLDYDFLSAGILLGASEVIACIFVGLCAQRMNKKLVLSVSSFLTAGISFLMVFLNSEYAIMVTLELMIIILYVSFPLLISIVVELFPTTLRSSASSVVMTSSRLGSAIGSQVMGILFENYCKPTYLGFTSILLASGIICILIPTQRKMS